MPLQGMFSPMHAFSDGYVYSHIYNIFILGNSRMYIIYMIGVYLCIHTYGHIYIYTYIHTYIFWLLGSKMLAQRPTACEFHVHVLNLRSLLQQSDHTE